MLERAHPERRGRWYCLMHRGWGNRAAERGKNISGVGSESEGRSEGGRERGKIREEKGRKSDARYLADTY